MIGSSEKIPDEVLKEIFPKKLKKYLVSDLVYDQLKQMIISGRLKGRRRLTRDEIALTFGVSKMAVGIAFSQLKKDGLLTSKRGIGSFVVCKNC